MNVLNSESERLSAFLATHRKLVVLTGAGISYQSGIPTYRDNTGKWLSRTPIQEQAFLQDEHTRRRYWARSWYGWPLIRDAQPNSAHVALAQLEARGSIQLLITQNVDRLHQKAGSANVLDLHGRVDRVRCLACEHMHTRADVQAILKATNEWPETIPQTPRPDGDMDIPDDLLDDLVPPTCTACGGVLMPDVVFFGGNVPKTTVQQCMEAVEAADALLVVGSSLTVFSGFRFCRHAHKFEKPIAIANPGTTRADEFAQLRLYSPAETLLEAALGT